MTKQEIDALVDALPSYPVSPGEHPQRYFTRPEGAGGAKVILTENDIRRALYLAAFVERLTMGGTGVLRLLVEEDTIVFVSDEGQPEPPLGQRVRVTRVEEGA